MAITFQCQCGKRLKARETNAGRRTVCPQCGTPVGIPTRHPTHRGAKELSNSIGATRLSKRAPRSRSRSSPRASVPEIRLRSRPRWIRLCGPTRPGAYPEGDPLIGGLFLLAGISAAVALGVSITISFLPDAMHEGWLRLPHGPPVVFSVSLLLAGTMYAASFMGQAVSESFRIGANSWEFDPAVNRAARFTSCGLLNLLSGPALLLGGAVWYWMNCGLVTSLDYLILAELTVAGIGIWLALSIGSAGVGRAAIIDPGRLSGLLQRIGLRGALRILLASLLMALHLSAAIWFCGQIRGGQTGAGVPLAGCLFSGIMLTTLILCRSSRVLADRSHARVIDSPTQR